jgi:predicted esterase YcpF (UPF0227 family)
MKDIEYVNISNVKEGDTIILTKYPIGNEYGAKFKVIGKTRLQIILKREGDETKTIYELQKHYPKVYKVVE